MGGHRERGQHAALDQEMRIVPHDLPVLAGPRLGFVGIDHEVVRTPIRLLGHEGPFQARREAGTAAPAQPGRLHLVDDPVAAHFQQELGAVPRAALPGLFQTGRMQTVQIGEDAILIGEHVRSPSRWRTASSVRSVSVTIRPRSRRRRPAAAAVHRVADRIASLLRLLRPRPRRSSRARTEPACSAEQSIPSGRPHRPCRPASPASRRMRYAELGRRSAAPPRRDPNRA